MRRRWMVLPVVVALCAAVPVWAEVTTPGTSAAPTACPTTNVVAGPAGTVSKYSATTSARTFDLSATTVTLPKKIGVTVTGTDICVLGPSMVNGITDATLQWWKLKQCCSGWGAFKVTGSATLVNNRADNIAMDMYQFGSGMAYEIDGAYGTYIRDDCITDLPHVALTVNDSLFDGCHTGISWRSSAKHPPAFPLTINDSLFYIQPQPGSTSGGKCTQWVVNSMANAGMWKMDSFKGTADTVHVNNTVIRIDLRNHECDDKWPVGTYNNVTLVWTGAGSYPAVPAGVTVTTDVSVWNDAKQHWLDQHGYAEPTPDPTDTDTPTPDPTDTGTPTPDPTDTGTPAPEPEPPPQT
jgi:hypothetical protein